MGRGRLSFCVSAVLWGATMAFASGAIDARALAAATSVRISPSRITFGKAILGVVGATTPRKTINIRNPGHSALTLDSIGLAGADASDFAILSDNCPVSPSTLAAGARCQVELTFTPTALGQREAQLEVSSSAGGQAVSLSGLGAAGALTNRPARLNFGMVKAGSTSAGQTVTLTNHNPVALSISALSASTGFAVAQNCVGNLSGNGGQCAVSVTFAPPGKSYAKPTPINGTLTISSDTSTSPITIALEGTAFGTAPPPPFSTAQTFVPNHCNWITSYAAGAKGDAAPLAEPNGLCFPRGMAVDPNGATYVVNANDSVTIYPAGASGNVAPAAMIFGPNTGIHTPVGLALDKSGAIYVLNCGTCVGGDNPFDSITIFAPGSNGNVAPSAVIAGSDTTLMSSSAIGLDGNGNVYVTQQVGQVLIFAAGSTGNVAPTSMMQGGCNAGLCEPSGVAIDSEGRIYIASTDSDSTVSSVQVYAAGSSGVVTSIATIRGSNTNLFSAQGIALDKNENIWISGYDSLTQLGTITSYPAGSNGNVTPTVTISGSSTGLNLAYALGLDNAGNLYVANYTGSLGEAGSVAIFAPASDGDVAPTAVIVSDAALNGPTGIALDSSGNVYVANSAGGPNQLGSVTVYPSGSDANVAPAVIISGPDTGLDTPNGIAVGASGKIYVSNLGNNSITVYSPGSNGDQPPTATIIGSNTMLDDPRGVAVDRNENIYVLNCSDCVPTPFLNAITIYPAGSDGNVAPSANFQCLGGDVCGLDFPLAIAVDSTGKIYVSNAGSLAGVIGELDTVTVYHVTESGQIGGPIATISGSNTGLAIPTGVAVDANANIYVSNAVGGPFALGSVTVYPAGSNGNATAGATVTGLDTLLEEPFGVAALP